MKKLSTKTTIYPVDPDFISLGLNIEEEISGSSDAFDVTSAEYQVKNLKWRIKCLKELLSKEERPRWYLNPLPLPTIVTVAMFQLFITIWCFLAFSMVVDQQQQIRKAESIVEGKER